jgi:hypothetical protein
MRRRGDAFYKVWHKTQPVLKILAHWPLENCSLSCNCMQIGFFFAICWSLQCVFSRPLRLRGMNSLFVPKATHETTYYFFYILTHFSIEALTVCKFINKIKLWSKVWFIKFVTYFYCELSVFTINTLFFNQNNFW